MTQGLSMSAAMPPLPKGPVFSWDSLGGGEVRSAGLPCVEDLAHTAFMTSGRAAIYHALLQMELPPGSTVLVPTYHCPTMVAPVLLAGHLPSYFGIRDDGLPDLARIDGTHARQARAMIVSQYFGLSQSLQDVRDWCDLHGILLIEDCAHSYFGQAGSRPIGAWGDYCTASLSKFFPVPEAGLLASAHHPLKPLHLAPRSAHARLKGWIDVLETAARFKRLQGFNAVLGGLFRLKAGLRSAPALAGPDGGEPQPADQMMLGCDMGRVDAQVLGVSMALRRWAPLDRIVAARARNYALYRELLGHLPGMPALAALPHTGSAPYVYPVWVDDADRVYHGLRALGVPVFRWDRIWAGTPASSQDTGPRWSRHLLQFLCHQDLRDEDIRYSARSLVSLLAPARTHQRRTTPSPDFQT
jgi:perosamine synthetase